jgi:hypothetical protein
MPPTRSQIEPAQWQAGAVETHVTRLQDGFTHDASFWPHY